MKKRLVAFGLVLIMACVSGCGSTATGTGSASGTGNATESVTESGASAETYKAIGNKTDSATELKIVLTNKTGKNIKGVTVRKEEEEAYPDNFLADGDIFTADESRELYFDPGTTEDSESGSTESSDSGSSASIDSDAADKETVPAYYLQFTFEDDTSLELHTISFTDTDQAELYLNQDATVIYLKYTSAQSGEEVSTEGAEEAILSQKQAEEVAAQQAAAEQAAKEEAEKQAQAEKEKAEQAAQKASTKKTTTKSTKQQSTTTQQSSTPAANSQQSVAQPEQSSAPAANPDAGCLGDDAATY